MIRSPKGFYKVIKTVTPTCFSWNRMLGSPWWIRRQATYEYIGGRSAW